MSGQPYRYASDREKYRAEYMRNLQERIDLDEQVYQAVKGYVSNGTLPAVSQIPDTRSTSQKLLDIEKLKQDLIKDLEPIMSQSIASDFIQALVQSPLNIDNKLITFLAQNSGELVKELSKKYKYGIKGDSNDIYTFVEFINNAYAMTNNTKASIKSIMDGGYSKSQGMVNRRDLEMFLQDVMKAFTQASISGIGTVIAGINEPRILQLLEAIRDKIRNLVNFLPSDMLVMEMERHISTGDMPLDSALNEAIIYLFGWMKENLPNKQYVISLANTVSSELFNGMRTGSISIGVIIQSLEKIYEILPDINFDLPIPMRDIENALMGPDDGGDDNSGSTQPGSQQSSLSSQQSSLYSLPTAPDSAFEERMMDMRRRLEELGQGGDQSSVPDANLVDLRARLDALNSSAPSMPIQQRDLFMDDLQARFSALQQDPQTPRELSRPAPIARKPGIIATDEAFSSRRPLGAPPPGLDDLQEEEWVSGLSRQALEDHERYLEQYEPNDTGKLLRVRAILRGRASRTMVTKPSGVETDANIHTGSKRISKATSNISDKVRIKELQDEIKLTEKEFTALQTAYDDTPESMTKLRDSLQRQYLTKVGVMEALQEELDQLKSSTGNGLRRGRPKGTGFKQNIEKHIDTQKGIQPDFRFSKFGKYLIRNDHLMDNKVSIRTGKGLNIAGLPSTKTNPKVITIIKKIIGGSLPTFDEMNKLTEEEKRYLHDISKKANILEKLNIPTPSKDKEEKDFNEFEILRGEIMAGNDNKDLVRKFKGYLLKFSKTGQLPKQQVNEILQDMLDMNL